MLVEIVYSPGTGLYTWKLWDGPDGIDYRMGYKETLTECFAAVEAAQTEIGLQYAQEVVG